MQCGLINALPHDALFRFTQGGVMSHKAINLTYHIVYYTVQELQCSAKYWLLQQDEWTAGQMNGLKVSGMKWWSTEPTDGRLNSQMNGLTEQNDNQTDGWMDEQLVGWTDVRIQTTNYFCISTFYTWSGLRAVSDGLSPNDRKLTGLHCMFGYYYTMASNNM